MNGNKEPVLEADFLHNIHCSFVDGVFYRCSRSDCMGAPQRQQIYKHGCPLAFAKDTKRTDTFHFCCHHTASFHLLQLLQKTPNYCTYQYASSLLSEFSELLSLSCLIPCLHTPAVEPCDVCADT